MCSRLTQVVSKQTGKMLILFLLGCFGLGHCLGEDFGDLFEALRIPTFAYPNGQYFGQGLESEATGQTVPHGIGSYLTMDGRVVYAGRWFRGYMNGFGNYYLPDGRNYSGHFEHNMLHGHGQMNWPNGSTFWGDFRYNRMSGRGVMQYANGNRRKGTLENDVWDGEAVLVEKDGTEWTEHWINGTFRPKVKISKRIEDHYTNILVEVVCKVHGPSPKATLFKDGVPTKISTTTNEDILILTLQLPFSDELFKTFSCQTIDNDGNVIEDTIQIGNPFLVQSHGGCGAQFSTGVRDKREILDRSARLVGGKPGRRGQVPWQALLHTNVSALGKINDSLGDYCGGVIIGPWHILTAAHCLYITDSKEWKTQRRLRSEEITVKVGYIDRLKSSSGQDHSVHRIYVHPDFNQVTFFNDIGLIVLKEKLSLNKDVHPICMPKPHLMGQVQVDQVPLTVSGYGQTYNLSNLEHGWHFPATLQVGSIRYLNASSCFKRREELALSFEGHFCAGVGDTTTRDFHTDSCSGDSGGPVTFKDKYTGRYHLVGLVSTGPLLCGSSPGAVYVNVSHYESWISRVRLDDLVQTYQDGPATAVPFSKMDSSIMQSMLQFMSEHRNDILNYI